MPSNDDGTRSLLRTVSRTGLFNLGATLVGALNGILIARLLGPDGRGDYASIISILGFTMLGFELGIGSGVVFWCARDRYNAFQYLKQATLMLAALAMVAGGVDTVVAHVFVTRPSRADAAVLLPVAIAIAFLAAPATFGLQAIDIRAWNLSRLAQPIAFIIGVGTLSVLAIQTSPLLVTAAYCVSLVAQGALARVIMARRVSALSVHSGISRPLAGEARKRLLNFGLANLLSTAPYTLNARLDQLLLAFMVPAASLGNYAVAVSLSTIISPLVGAFGNVAFPLLARGADVAHTVRTIMRGALITSVIGSVLAVLAGFLLIPLVYGKEYGEAFHLLVALAPGACFVTTNQVLGDLLRGMNRSRRVAICEWSGAVLTVALLALAIPQFGAAGAAWTSSLVYGVVFVLLTREVKHVREAGL